jgi:peptide/nickel transport system ATP-binding protein
MRHGEIVETAEMDLIRSVTARHAYTRQLLTASRGYDRAAVDLLNL